MTMSVVAAPISTGFAAIEAAGRRFTARLPAGSRASPAARRRARPAELRRRGARGRRAARLRAGGLLAGGRGAGRRRRGRGVVGVLLALALVLLLREPRGAAGLRRRRVAGAG